MVKDLLTLYDPINTFKPVDAGISIVAGPIVQMAMYGYFFYHPHDDCTPGQWWAGVPLLGKALLMPHIHV